VKRQFWLFLFILLPIGLLVYNIAYASDVYEYLETPLSAIINIIVALLFAFFLTQFQTDHRRKIDLVSDKIRNTISILEDQRMYKFDVAQGGSAYGYVKHRLIKQRLNSLDVYKKKFKFENDLEKVKDELNEWWLTFSEVMENQTLADAHMKVLCIHITNTISFLEKIQIRIFE